MSDAGKAAGSPNVTSEAGEAGRYPGSSPGADRFLRALFYLAQTRPALLSRLAPMLAGATWRVAGGVRASVLDNLGHILPGDTPAPERSRVGKAVLHNFIRFIADLGQAQAATPQMLIDRVAAVEGETHYEQARAMQRGAVIATAHLGSFEVGLAVTAQRERGAHVVFATDPFPRFEQLRTSLRQKLGVHEARVEAGWAMWGRLRDALERDEVVVMQADRLMPGQKGIRVPLLGAEAQLPTGPVRLAQLTGSPILPTFALREPDGRAIRIVIEQPIMVPQSGDPRLAQHTAMVALADSIGRVIRRQPEQWLMLHRAWVEG